MRGGAGAGVRACLERGVHMPAVSGASPGKVLAAGGEPRPTFLFRADAERVWRPHLPSTCSLWGEGER